MTVTTLQSPSTAADRPATPVALVVELDPADDTALLRVLSLLARRRCGVLRAAFAPEPAGGFNLLSIEVVAPRDLDLNVIAWLSSLVPVQAVRYA